ncbi:MAG: DNA metabolism protein [Clostridiaceae bacterium]|nr:DNA metabolism protein [Clostridiaceae bacterium]
MIYVTDGSFEGILAAVFEAFRNREDPEEITLGGDFQLSIAAGIREIPTDTGKSDRVWRGVQNRISEKSLEDLYLAYLSEHPRVGLYIYRYIKLGLKLGHKVEEYLQHPDVQAIYDLSRRVSKEVHLFLGILRFKKLKNGVFYACYEPDNNITQLITEHFASRLSDQAWIIHDRKRDVFALHNGEEVVFTTGLSGIVHEDCEEEYEELWRRYFTTIAIESRKNLKLQRSFMPRRYWKHLTEKQL